MAGLSPVQTEQRSDVIWRHLRAFMLATNTSAEVWSMTVVLNWLEIPDEIRPAGVFRERGDPFAMQKHNGRKIRRWVNGEESATPNINVENTLVLSLPEPWRSDLERDLALMRGRLSVPMVKGSSAAVECAGKMVRHIGEAIIELAPALADGQINEHDSPDVLQRAEKKLIDAQASLHAVIERVREAQALIAKRNSSVRP